MEGQPVVSNISDDRTFYKYGGGVITVQQGTLPEGMYDPCMGELPPSNYAELKAQEAEEEAEVREREAVFELIFTTLLWTVVIAGIAAPLGLGNLIHIMIQFNSSYEPVIKF